MSEVYKNVAAAKVIYLFWHICNNYATKTYNEFLKHKFCPKCSKLSKQTEVYIDIVKCRIKYVKRNQPTKSTSL